MKFNLKNKIKLTSLILGALFSFCSWSQSLSNGGGWSGSGGDTNLFKDNAWFLKGREAIPYCIWRNPDFNFSFEDLSSLVKESFDDWKIFFDKYKISERGLTFRSHPGRFGGVTQGRALGLNFKNEGVCPSDKALPNGLMFVFGKTENSHIKMFNKYGTENALGFAIRNKDYDHKAYKNPGYIWISNLFKEKGKLKHMLLHELGHVFGMTHDSVFVMDSDVASLLKKENISSNRFIGKIESPSWPYDFLPNNSLRLTYKKRPLGERRVNRCPDNYFPNRMLPPRIFSLLSNAPLRGRARRNRKGCFSLSLKWSKHSGQKKFRNYQLVIENLRGRKVHLEGLFEVTRGDFIEGQTGPEVFTKLPTGQWERGYFYRKKGMLPARGEFVLRNLRGPHSKGFKMAAKVTVDKGITLEMIHPKFKKWWVLNSSSSNNL